MNATIYSKIRWQFILFLARRLPDCKTITPLLGEALDRKLSLRTRIVTRLHLFTCEACQHYAEQIKFLRDALRENEAIMAAAGENFSAALSGDAKQRIKRALSSTIDIA